MSVYRLREVQLLILGVPANVVVAGQLVLVVTLQMALLCTSHGLQLDSEQLTQQVVGYQLVGCVAAASAELLAYINADYVSEAVVLKIIKRGEI